MVKINYGFEKRRKEMEKKRKKEEKLKAKAASKAAGASASHEEGDSQTLPEGATPAVEQPLSSPPRDFSMTQEVSSCGLRWGLGGANSISDIRNVLG